ncbi:MAG: lysophospholipid acyltransferase family protein [Bacteroidetes bacterium]|nr:lysophospholipid acyltransferase family protein [Bacteroidota bacterium]
MIILIYLLYYLVIIPISFLPFPMLYAFSDFLYFFIYVIFGYRKKVVFTNLRNSFPEKSEEEINRIARLFYHHFCDLVVESLKSFTVSEEEILKRMVLKNPELLNSYYDQGKSIILSGGHYNNWEWIAIALDQQIKHQSIAIYKTLANKFFDEKMRSTRSRYGLMMISTKSEGNFEEYKHQLTATIFANDQSPRKSENNYWTTFLNQDTAVLFGTEKYAKDYNYPVLFGSIDKVKRGYYTLNFTVVENDPVYSPYGAITEKTTRILEQQILKAPQYWLWTHRRWKHRKEK